MNFSREHESASGSPSENGIVLTRGIPTTMNTSDALRWLAFEARRCRDRDSAEALCLLFPPMLAALDLTAMDDIEARAFKERVREALKSDLKKEAA